MSTIAEKAEHVRQARQTRDHTCHWPGCEEQVPPARFSCRRHWYALPPSLRAKVWQAYRIGQEQDGKPSERYVEVMSEVREWIAKHQEAMR